MTISNVPDLSIKSPKHATTHIPKSVCACICVWVCVGDLFHSLNSCWPSVAHAIAGAAPEQAVGQRLLVFLRHLHGSQHPGEHSGQPGSLLSAAPFAGLSLTQQDHSFGWEGACSTLFSLGVGVLLADPLCPLSFQSCLCQLFTKSRRKERKGKRKRLLKLLQFQIHCAPYLSSHVCVNCLRRAEGKREKGREKDCWNCCSFLLWKWVVWMFPLLVSWKVCFLKRSYVVGLKIFV